MSGALTILPPSAFFLTGLWDFDTAHTLFKQPKPGNLERIRKIFSSKSSRETAKMSRYLGYFHLVSSVFAFVGFRKQRIRAKAALFVTVVNLVQLCFDLAWRKKGGWNRPERDLVPIILMLTALLIKRLTKDEEEEGTVKGGAPRPSLSG